MYEYNHAATLERCPARLLLPHVKLDHIGLFKKWLKVQVRCYKGLDEKFVLAVKMYTYSCFIDDDGLHAIENSNILAART